MHFYMQTTFSPAMRCRKPAVTPAGTSSQKVSSRLPSPLTASARTAGESLLKASPKAANCLVSTSSVSSLLASGSCTHPIRIRVARSLLYVTTCKCPQRLHGCPW